ERPSEDSAHLHDKVESATSSTISLPAAVRRDESGLREQKLSVSRGSILFKSVNHRRRCSCEFSRIDFRIEQLQNGDSYGSTR
ncbi:hypothetical protein ALC56_11155, partial [Trachymyrmex septentrionalis]